jgi:hypothetical protein
MEVNAKAAYEKYFGQERQRVPLWDTAVVLNRQQKDGKYKLTAETTLAGGHRQRPRSAQEQFELDVAFWYGALTEGKHEEIELLRRVFTILYYGGLLYYGSSGWDQWSRSNIPIAAALSHGGRVLIQLPRASSGEPDAFFRWLQAPSGIISRNSRLAATHGIEPFAVPIPLRGLHRWHRLNETKSGGNGRHYGVNISLGGTGNINPISGNTIYSNGEHGHLYVYYLAPTADSYGGLLIGLEGSAPIDAWDNRGLGHTPGSPQRLGKLGGGAYGAVAWSKDHLPKKMGGGPELFTPDQTGGYHKFGARQKYSPTGNAKWNELDVGPRRIYNAMLVDLAELGWESVAAQLSVFTPELLGKCGVSPIVPPPVQMPPIILTTSLIESNLKRLATVVEEISEDMATLRSGNSPMVKDYNATPKTKRPIVTLGLRKVKDYHTEKPVERMNPRVAQYAHDAILSKEPMDSMTWQKFSSIRLGNRSLLHTVDAVVDECLRLTAREIRQCRQLQIVGGNNDYADRAIAERRKKLLELVQAITRYLDLPQARSDKHTPKVKALHALVLTELKLLDEAKHALKH